MFILSILVIRDGFGSNCRVFMIMLLFLLRLFLPQFLNAPRETLGRADFGVFEMIAFIPLENGGLASHQGCLPADAVAHL